MAVATGLSSHVGELHPTGSSLSRKLIWPMALLTTGTSLALYAQLVTNQRATHPSSQIIAWTKYFVNFLISSSLGWFGHRGTGRKVASMQSAFQNFIVYGPRWPEAEAMCITMGLLDVVAYSLNCMGFPLCGSALSMVVFAASGQIFTALARTFLLGKPMLRQQQAAVGVVVIGLIVRGAPWTLLRASKVGIPRLGHNQALGIGYLVASAACYSMLGVIYEKLFSSMQHSLSHADVNLRMSIVGLASLTGYQVVYTWPRRQQLVFDLMEAGGLGPIDVILMLGGFGWLFTAHSYVQGQVLERSGAMTVGIINALRAVTVTVASAGLFCSVTSPNQCLTLAAALSAVIITIGVMLWSTAGLKPPIPASKESDEATHDKQA